MGAAARGTERDSVGAAARGTERESVGAAERGAVREREVTVFRGMRPGVLLLGQDQDVNNTVEDKAEVKAALSPRHLMIGRSTLCTLCT